MHFKEKIDNTKMINMNRLQLTKETKINSI